MPRFGGGKVEAFGGGIERHGLRSWRGLNGLHRGVLVGRILVKDVDCAVAVGEEDEASVGVESGGVNVIADGKRLDHFSSIGIDDGCHVATAADKQAPVFAVHCHGSVSYTHLNPNFQAATVKASVGTAQVAPTILETLHIDPSNLDAVKAEGTPVLPAVQFK